MTEKNSKFVSKGPSKAKVAKAEEVLATYDPEDRKTVTGFTPSPDGRFITNDPRANRKGRPRNFDALRTLAKLVAHEVAQRNGQYVIYGGERITVAEMILRGWAYSEDFQTQKHFMEVAFGKVPTVTEISGPGGGPVPIKGYANFNPDDWDEDGK